VLASLLRWLMLRTQFASKMKICAADAADISILRPLRFRKELVANEEIKKSVS